MTLVECFAVTMSRAVTRSMSRANGNHINLMNTRRANTARDLRRRNEREAAAEEGG